MCVLVTGVCACASPGAGCHFESGQPIPQPGGSIIYSPVRELCPAPADADARPSSLRSEGFPQFNLDEAELPSSEVSQDNPTQPSPGAEPEGENPPSDDGRDRL